MVDGLSPGGNIPYFPPPASAQLGAATTQMLTASGVRPQKKRWGALCFWMLFAICLVELNGLGAILFKEERVFSYLMLVLCLLILGIFQFTILRDIGMAGRIYLIFLIVYLLIAGRIGFFGSALERAVVLYRIRSLIPSFLVVASCAMATRHLVLVNSPNKTMRTLFICSLLPVGALYLGLYWAPLHNYVVSLRGGRFSGFFTNANSAGFAMCVTAVVGFSYLVSGKMKGLAFAGIFAAAVAVILTFSRSAILIFAVLIIVQIIISPVFKRKMALLAIIVITAGLGWFFMLGLSQLENLSPVQKDRLEGITRIVSFSAEEDDLGGRYMLASVGIKQWLEHPIMGHGIGYMSSIPELGGVGVHNTYLLILGDSGVFPATLFVIFLLVFLYDAWRCRIPALRTLALGFWCLFVMICIVGHGVLEDKNMAALMGVCLGALAASKELQRLTARMRQTTMAPANTWSHGTAPPT